MPTPAATPRATSVIGLVNNVRAVGASDGVVAVTVVGVVVGDGVDGAPVVLQVTVKFWVTLPVPPDGAFTVIVLGVIVHCMLGGLN